MTSDMPTDRKAVFEEIKRCINQKINKKRYALGFSGGLDSTILAVLCSNCRMYTVGLPNSWDIERAKYASRILNRRTTVIEICEEDVLEAVRDIYRITGEDRGHIVAFEIPLYILCSRVRENRIVLGQGADELFGGYRKYMGADGAKRMEEDRCALNATVLREKLIAKAFGKDLIYPYLFPCVVRFAESLEFGDKIRGGARKAVLRDFAAYLGLPESIVHGEKKAAQYGTGIVKLLRKLAKKNGMMFGEYVRWVAKCPK